jgi:hypothetical protein
MATPSPSKTTITVTVENKVLVEETLKLLQHDKRSRSLLFQRIIADMIASDEFPDKEEVDQIAALNNHMFKIMVEKGKRT